MNGFTHAILSLMLSWIRALINNVWTLITSEDGGMLYQFLSRSWLQIVLVLCAAGVVVDLIIYFFRWRPDYIWASRWRRARRNRRKEEPVPQEPEQSFFQEPSPAPSSPTMAYAPMQQSTAVYAPASQPTRFYAPVQDLDEPVFDEEDALWDDAAQPLATDWDMSQSPAFGSPKPEPITHYHHVEAGYARPVAPEQLYAPSPSYQSPVHPGLDEDAFRQNIGLYTDEDEIRAIPVMRAPAFKPFTVVEDEPVKAENPFARFAKRARTLVGMADEENGPTIRDLQSTVDVSQAFHAPVYPQPMNHHKEG